MVKQPSNDDLKRLVGWTATPDDLIDAGLTPKTGTAVAAAMRADEADDQQSRDRYVAALVNVIHQTPKPPLMFSGSPV